MRSASRCSIRPWRELVAAFVPRTGSEIDGVAVRRFLEGRLSSYKIPVAILRVGESQERNR